jgi:hypothetical protein
MATAEGVIIKNLSQIIVSMLNSFDMAVSMTTFAQQWQGTHKLPSNKSSLALTRRVFFPTSFLPTRSLPTFVLVIGCARAEIITMP